MEFRPCIDIHDGKVKQIVGGSLNDSGAMENFVASQTAEFYGLLYKEKNIKGGHVILLNKAGTPEYELTKKAAFEALAAYKGGLQVGGGINASNAKEFIDAGASQVIVTSYVFRDGLIDYGRLEELLAIVGREHLVLDLSCRKRENDYYIVTDRWQKFTDTKLTVDTMKELEKYASEYLIHAVDVEGKSAGPDNQLIAILNEYQGIPVTYAGGVHSFDDLRIIRDNTNGRVNVTIGSALDLFGGDMKFEEVLEYCK